MAVVENSNPSRDIGGYISKAVSTTQLLYDFTRKDYNVDRSVASSDVIILDAVHGDVTAEFTAGDKIYVSDKSTEFPDGVLTVQSVSFGATETQVFVVEDFILTGGNAYMNSLTARDAYVLEMSIPELNNLLLYYVPDSKGVIKFNLGPAIERGIQRQKNVNPNYTEYWKGGNSATVPSTPIFAVVSIRQLMAEHGANLYLYTANPTAPCDFQTVFSQPKKWKGWSHVLNFISMDYTLISFVFNELDINFNVIGTINGSSSIVNPDLATVSIPEPGSNNTKYIRFNGTDAVDGIVTSDIIIQIEDECDNQVMVQWVNRLGGVDSWVFQNEQLVMNISEEGYLYQSPLVDDIEINVRTKGRYSPNDIQYMTLNVDNLTQDELQGLHDLKESRDVKVMLTKDLTEFVNVRIVSTYEDSFTTGKSGYEFSVKIEFPDNFDFFKAKQY